MQPVPGSIMKTLTRLIATTFVLSVGTSFMSAAVADDEIKLIVIHMGDVHGHMIPRSNARSDSKGGMEGGWRACTPRSKDTRQRQEEFAINVSDTVQGSAETCNSCPP